MIRCLAEAHGKSYAAYHGDGIDIVRQLPDASIDLSVYSPPFAGLYIYNDSVADMGNCKDDAEFFEHYRFLVREMFRVTRPGRLSVVHCKDLVYYQTQRGTAGLRDFPGEVIRAHVDAGFDFHSRVTIWRDPVREMTKTKAHGLLYKQLRANSTISRQGLPEYLVVFRKWPRTEEEHALADASPVTHTKATFALPQWQEWASPVWMDTRETDVLNKRAAKAPGDEKHICPLALDLIGRAITLWSNPLDTVLTPCGGIGSEAVVALQRGRRAILVELKDSYFRQAVRYLDAEDRQEPLKFDEATAAEATP